MKTLKKDNLTKSKSKSQDHLKLDTPTDPQKVDADGRDKAASPKVTSKSAHAAGKMVKKAVSQEIAQKTVQKQKTKLSSGKSEKNVALSRSQSVAQNEKTVNPEQKPKKKIVKIVRKIVTKGSSKRQDKGGKTPTGDAKDVEAAKEKPDSIQQAGGQPEEQPSKTTIKTVIRRKIRLSDSDKTVAKITPKTITKKIVKKKKVIRQPQQASGVSTIKTAKKAPKAVKIKRVPLTLKSGEQIFRFLLRPFKNQDTVSRLQKSFAQQLTASQKCSDTCMVCFKKQPNPMDLTKLPQTQWFYMMAYCKGCKCHAHLGCLGIPKQKYQLLKQGNDRLLLFDCQTCQASQSSDASTIKLSCVACGRRGGVMRPIKNETLFVHQFCALILTDHFKVTNFKDLSVEMIKNEDQLDEKCDICKQQCGYLLPSRETEVEGQIKKRVHPYCIAVDPESAKKDKYKSEWSLQVIDKQDGLLILDKDSQDQAFVSFGFDWTKDKQLKHLSRKMTECEFCGVSYHNTSLKHQQFLKNNKKRIQEEKLTVQSQFLEAEKIKLKLRVPYKCARCKDWFQLLESQTFKDMFMRREENTLQAADTAAILKNTVSIDGQSWRRGMELMQSHTSVESSLFHVMMKAQLWEEISNKLTTAPTTLQLLNIHCDSLSKIEVVNMERSLENVKSYIEKSSVKNGSVIQSEQHEIQEVIGLQFMQSVDQQGNIDEQSMKVNLESQQRANDLLEKLLSQTHLIDGDILKVFIKRTQLDVITQAQEVIRKMQIENQKVTFEEVSHLFTSFEELSLTDQLIFSSSKLAEEFRAQKAWRKEIELLLEQNTKVTFQELKRELRNLRSLHNKNGIVLVQSRINHLREIFSSKKPLNDLQALLEKDKTNSLFDNSQYLQKLGQYQEEATLFDTSERTLYNLGSQEKPLQYLKHVLTQFASRPLRPDCIDRLMDIWYNSAVWTAIAKAFVAPDIATGQSESKTTDPRFDYVMDNNESTFEIKHQDDASFVDQKLLQELQQIGTEQHPEFLKKAKHLNELLLSTNTGSLQDDGCERLVFDLKHMHELQEAVVVYPTLIYEAPLLQAVRSKIKAYEDLKARLEDVCLRQHQILHIQSYISECNQITNFNLTQEIEIAKEKLSIMENALKICQADIQQDEGLVASEVYDKVLGLKERENNKILIPEEVELALENKVQISEQLRRDFYDILKRGADSYKQQMFTDLKNIVEKATKEHGLKMDSERKIVDNLGRSEQWFVATFARLKQVCGPSLHQIDFKDYKQLHSVIKSQADCEQLLKHNAQNFKSMESLVGAAKNLFTSLQGAKWLFDVKSIMDTQTGSKELSQLLQLFGQANALGIDFDNALKDEYILMDDEEQNSAMDRDSMILRDFSKLGQVAHEFDKLFGSHQKIIATLEKYEEDDKMQDLIQIVDRLQKELTQNRDEASLMAQFPPSLIKTEAELGRGYAIVTTKELEILTKVRSYIDLNRDYHDYMRRSASNGDEALVTNEREAEEESKIQAGKAQSTQKISYQKAMKLQRQARDANIPDDIPVLKKLNQSIQRFEKFQRQCNEYFKFRENIKRKGASLLQNQPSSQQRILQRTMEKGREGKFDTGQLNNFDSRFNKQFLQKLINEMDGIDIEIPAEFFDRDTILEELSQFQQWKVKTEVTLKALEKELNQTQKVDSLKPIDEDLEVRLESRGNQIISKTVSDQFQDVKDQIKTLPIYDADTFLRIQAFEWLLTATRLIQGEAAAHSDSHEFKVQSLGFWQTLYKQHEGFLKVLPMLDDHPIIQNILWEIDRAQKVVEFVKTQKKNIQSNSGKFLSDKYFNYVAFKDKQQPEYLQRLIESCKTTRVDIATELSVLRDWLKTYERYTEMHTNGTLYTSNDLEKVKVIHRNVFLSPLDFGDLYFEISQRLEIASQIQQDIRNIMQENQLANKEQNKVIRVKFSRIQTDLNHYERNCQIPGIKEIDKVVKQIKQSRQLIEECKTVLLQECEGTEAQVKQLEKARAIQKTIEIDMEKEEHEIRKIMFLKNFKLIQDVDSSDQESSSPTFQINADQFKALSKEFSRVVKNLVDEKTVESWTELRENYEQCLEMIRLCPTKELLKDAKESVKDICPQVNFEQQFIDKAALLFHDKKRRKHSGDDEKMEISSSGSDNESDSSSSDGSDSGSSSSSSSNSQDGSSSSSDEEDSESKSSAKDKKEKVKADKKENKTSEQSKEEKKVGEEQEESEEEDQKKSESVEDQSSVPDSAGKDSQYHQDATKTGLAFGRMRRQVKANRMQDHVYYDAKEGGGTPKRRKRPASDDESSQSEASEESSDSQQSNEHSQQVKRRRIEKRNRKEAKMAAKQFNKQKQRQNAIKERRQAEELQQNSQKMGLYMNDDGGAQNSAGFSNSNQQDDLDLGNDRELQNQLQRTKERIRTKSKQQIRDMLNKFDLSVFAKKIEQQDNSDQEKEKEDIDPEANKESILTQIENTIFQKNSSVNQIYMKKISDCCENLRKLLQHVSIAELFFSKKSLSLNRLVQNKLVFFEQLKKIIQTKNERDRKSKSRVEPPNINSSQDRSGVSVPAQQSLLPLAYPGNRPPSKISDLKPAPRNFIKVDEEAKKRSNSLGSVDSLESNPAAFSDDDTGAGLAKRPDSYGFHKQRQPLHFMQSNIVAPHIIPLQHFKYNPYSIVEQTKLENSNQRPGFFSLSGAQIHGQKKQAEMILYDPIKQASKSMGGQAAIKIRNTAQPGSLLKIWEGGLQLGEQTDQFQCQMFSVGDIRNYQLLPELPSVLHLKGKSKIQEVTSHFMKVRQDVKLNLTPNNVLLKGWVTRKNFKSQENSERYSKHFDFLESQERCSVFKMFESMSLYLVPITEKTKSFCKQMGVVPLKPINYCDGKPVYQSIEEKYAEETHFYAFFCQVRQKFDKKSSYLNPSVICQVHDMPTVQTKLQLFGRQLACKAEKRQVDQVVEPEVQALSPISSVEGEENQQREYRNSKQPVTINLIQPAFPVVKNEIVIEDGLANVPIPQQVQTTSQNAGAFERDEDEENIDALINKFRSQEEPNIDQIQQELLPIIHKFNGSGRKEDKLEAFLKEVIAKINSQNQRAGEQQQSTMQPEPPMPLHQDMSHVAPRGYQMPPYGYQNPVDGGMHGYGMPPQYGYMPHQGGPPPPNQFMPSIRPPQMMPQAGPQMQGYPGQMPPHMDMHMQPPHMRNVPPQHRQEFGMPPPQMFMDRYPPNQPPNPNQGYNQYNQNNQHDRQQ